MPRMEEFKERLIRLYGLTPQSADLLLEHTERIRVPKGSVLAAEGERCRSLFFVEHGYIRGYTVRNEREATFAFALEGDCIGALPDPAGRARLTLEAVEASTLLRIRREELEELYDQSPELARMGLRMAERQLEDYHTYFLDYFWASPEVQYDAFVRNYRPLLQRARLRDIASYLRLTPQSLSRIRRRRRK